jgi:hypothetical protein
MLPPQPLMCQAPRVLKEASWFSPDATHHAFQHNLPNIYTLGDSIYRDSRGEEETRTLRLRVIVKRDKPVLGSNLRPADERRGSFFISS